MNPEEAKRTLRAMQILVGAEPDGDPRAEFREKVEAMRRRAWGLDQPMPAPDGRQLVGDGTWDFSAAIEGEDIVVRGARCTCFGGDADPNDNGQTASGIPTRNNPELKACALPMDGRQFSRMTRAEHAALDGSPIPRIPWQTIVRVSLFGQPERAIEVPVIDLGPAKRTGNAIDLTIAAAQFFHPRASATNFAIRVDYRILGAAKYAPAAA